VDYDLDYHAPSRAAATALECSFNQNHHHHQASQQRSDEGSSAKKTEKRSTTHVFKDSSNKKSASAQKMKQPQASRVKVSRTAKKKPSSRKVMPWSDENDDMFFFGTPGDKKAGYREYDDDDVCPS
jgi:deoxyribodipyrimidine photolyase